MAEVTRWLPRTVVSALRKASRVTCAFCSARPAALFEPSSMSASARCSTETYSSFRRLASESAASSSCESRCVTKTCPGAVPGPVDFGRRDNSASISRSTSSGTRRHAQSAGAPVRSAGSIAPPASARRPPRCGRAAGPASGPRSGLPVTSGSGGSGPCDQSPLGAGGRWRSAASSWSIRSRRSITRPSAA